MPAWDVLIVDDTEDCRTVLRNMLLGEGCTVRTAENGRQALEEIDARRPDIVLLDVMMPEMSGLEVLERIRTDPGRASLPVILVTASSDDDDVMVGYQHGADYYITKPCTARQVVRGIALVLGEAAEAIEPPPPPGDVPVNRDRVEPDRA